MERQFRAISHTYTDAILHTDMRKMLRMGGFDPPIINESYIEGHQFVAKNAFFSTNICIYKYIYIPRGDGNQCVLQGNL